MKIVQRLDIGQASWSDLLKLTDVSEPVLASHLRSLIEKGWIGKNKSSGLYEITEEGKYQLQAQKVEREIQSSDQFRMVLETAQKSDSKLTPETRNLLLAYGFFLGVARISLDGSTAKFKKMNHEAATKAEAIRKMLESYSPEYTSPFERVFNSLSNNISSVMLLHALAESLEPKEGKKSSESTQAQKLLVGARRTVRSLYLEVMKDRVKEFVGMKS
jgi:DNA-binding HxlR family transcriptional regulator